MHEIVVRDLEAAMDRTLGPTDLDEPTLVAQHDPLMGRWCGIWPTSASRKSCGCCATAARPCLLTPDVEALYDAFKHRRDA